jgi:mannosyl-oligosaccharide glucosidase
MVVAPFDSGLAIQIMSDWFQLMDDNGWIAREQILGAEARTKVPEKFQVQYPHYANPPTLVISLAYLVGEMSKPGKSKLVIQDEHTEKHILFMSGNSILQDTNGKEAVENLRKAQVKDLFKGLVKNFEWYLKSQRNSVVKNQHLYRWRGRTRTHNLPSGKPFLHCNPRVG